MQKNSISQIEEPNIDINKSFWKIHSQIPEDKNLIRQWNELAEKQRVPSIFLTYEWISTWWQHFGIQKELFLITCTYKNQLVALAPMMLSRKPLFLLRPARVMEFIGTSSVPTRGMGLADRIDFLYSAHQPDLIVEIINKIFEHRSKFDLLLLRALPSTSPTITSLKNLCDKRGIKLYRSFRSDSPYTKTEGQWEAFLSSRKSKTRRQWFNSCRRLEEMGPYEFSCYPDNGWTFEKTMETILSIDKRSYKWENGTSLFQAPDLARFYTNFFQRICQNKWFIAHFLFIDGQPVAYQVGFRYAQCLFGYNTCYNKSFSKAHPGIHLLIQVIKKAFSEGLSEYDMMRGKELYKKHWSTNHREEIHIALYKRSMISIMTFLVYIKAKELLKKISLAKRIYYRKTRIYHG